jgi:hypothetical protein
MEKLTLEQFIADIETFFSNYTDTNDVDRLSIKGWVIDRLRMFGKNICEYREEVITVNNSRALLGEGFKSLTLALKIEGELDNTEANNVREIPYKKYITNDVVWDSLSQEYIKNNCQSQVVIEKLLINKEPLEKYMRVQPLSLIKGMQSSTLDANCYNLHPSIRNSYQDKISITNRALSTNFKNGLIYIQYNSLPMEDDEIAIPIITTGHIKEYIENFVKIKITESIIAANRNPQGLTTLLSLWMQQDNRFFIQAKSESNWSGLSDGWAKKMYQKRMENMSRFNLSKF